MNAQTLNTFYQRIKQSEGNHKPHRHRKSHGTSDEVLAKMKLLMAQRKAREQHKRVVSQARKRRGAASNVDCDYEYVVLNETERDDSMYDPPYMDAEGLGC